MGEHAVVQHRPGLIASIGRRVKLWLESTPMTGREAMVTLELRDLGVQEELSWAEIRDYAGKVNERWFEWMSRDRETDFAVVVGEDPAHVVKVALGEAAGWLGESHPEADLRLRVESELPIGGGLGSSAAVGVGVVAGYLTLCGFASKMEEIDALALQVERSQHGNPSGVDSCAVQRGGVLWAEYDVDGGLELEPVDALQEHLARFRLVDSGEPGESTGSVVAAVQSRIAEGGAAMQTLLDDMARDTRRLRDALRTPGSVESPIAPIRSYHRALELLGAVPPPVRAWIREIEELGGAAKISGAGSLAGPGAGAVLVYHPEIETVPARLSSAMLGELELCEIGFGVDGLTVHGLSSSEAGSAST